MKLGLIGTDKELTSGQKESLIKLLKKLGLKHDFLELHHGDFKGSDLNAHAIIIENELVNRIDVYPPKESDLRANIINEKGRREKKGVRLNLHEAKPEFQVSRVIVNSAELIFILTEDNGSQNSKISGAVGYAKSLKKKIVTIYPNGKTTVWPIQKFASGR